MRVMWRHRLRVPAVGALALAIVLSNVATALASVGIDPVAPSGERTAQIEVIISERGVSAAQAAQDVELEDQASGLLDQIEATMGDEFAGEWFNLQDGKLAIGIAPNNSTKVQVTSLAETNGLADNLEFVSVKSTEHELLDAKELWDGRFADASRGGARTGIDSANNRVVVEVADSTPADSLAQWQDLASKEGVAVDVKSVPNSDIVTKPEYLGECARHYTESDGCNPPLIGGMEIWAPNNVVCTGGFVAKSIYPETYPDHYLITAGHCLKGSSAQETGVWASASKTIAAHQIGKAAYSTVGSSGDAGFIDLTAENSYWEDSKVWGWYPDVATFETEWATSTHTKEAYFIKSPGTNEEKSVQEQTPCHSTGIANPYPIVCGLTTKINVTTPVEYSWGVVEVGNLVQNSSCGQKGDSGGPWFFNQYAMGIQVSGPTVQCSEGGGGYVYFDNIEQIEPVLGLNVVG
jgi:hypothetical protein